MLSRTHLLKIFLAAAALCAAPQAGAMRCELLYSGGPFPLNPSKFACLGDPAVGTPVSFWRKKDMGITWPNQADWMPHAFVVCKYNYIVGDRWVSWQTHFQKANGVWYPFPLDKCYFWCGGIQT